MSTYATPTSTKTGKTTYHVSEQTDALRTGRRPVARDDSLYADFLRCAQNLALLADHSGIDTADEDVDASQVLLELLEVVSHLPDADLDLLRQKLALARFPDELDGVGWDYGAPLADVKRLAAHWKDGFDWRKTEAAINEIPMYMRDVEVEGFGTLNVHYVHQKSEVEGAIPLLFVHGCECSLFCSRVRTGTDVSGMRAQGRGISWRWRRCCCS